MGAKTGADVTPDVATMQAAWQLLPERYQRVSVAVHELRRSDTLPAFLRFEIDASYDIAVTAGTVATGRIAPLVADQWKAVAATRSDMFDDVIAAARWLAEHWGLTP